MQLQSLTAQSQLNSHSHAIDLQPGDEVIVTSRTFLASASAIVMRGGVPVFADIDRNSQNISAETIAPLINKKTRAIIAVHLAGWPCEMDSICELAKENGLAVIEDCAQAHGATYKGQPVGTWGDMAAFSFCQEKIISTGGEGGLLVTNSEQLWKRAWSFKDHGKCYDAVFNEESTGLFRWLHTSFGTNWRMTEMQATIGRISLKRLPEWIKTRREHANTFLAELQNTPGMRLTIPPENVFHSYYKFYCFIEPTTLTPGWNRDRIALALQKEGITCGNGSCSEIYLEEAFTGTSFRPTTRLPVAQELGETSLMFQVHPTLKTKHIKQICTHINHIMNNATTSTQLRAA